MFPRQLIIICAWISTAAAFSAHLTRTASRPTINHKLLLRHSSPCLATVPKSAEEISPSLARDDDITKPLTSSPPSAASKLRQLKDRMWVREALEDLTAAEFASSLTVEDTQATASSTGENQSNRKRAVDFENVLNKLDARIEEMCVVTSQEISKQMNQTCHIIERRMPGSEGNTTIQNMCYSLAENIGMGSVVYNTEQREALLKRLIVTRGRLISFIEGSEMNRIEVGGGEGEGMGAIDDIRSQLQSEDYSTTIGQQPESSNASQSTFDPSLYVRDDGTIDWDGALQDREALKKFGSAVWSRINGQDPENKVREGQDLMSPGDEFHAQNKVVTAKIAETDAIRKKRDQLEREKLELQRLEIEHTKLLNSGKFVLVACVQPFIIISNLLI
jgi:hypothetical protein